MKHKRKVTKPGFVTQSTLHQVGPSINSDLILFHEINTFVVKNNIPESAVITTIIPCPQITSANMNPEEIQIFSLNGILFTALVMEKMCPRACSVLKHGRGEIVN